MDNIAVMGDNSPQMRSNIPSKQQTMREISELLGTPEILPTSGSSVPSVFFTSVAAAMGVPVVAGMPNMARKIIETAHLQWEDRFSSENTPSGGGGTVTAIGLMQVKNAILIWQGKEIVNLPGVITRDEWVPKQNWEAVRANLPRESQLVISRPGADTFREMVLSEYDNQCAVTGFQLKQTIEIAHIVPYYGPESDQIQNALPLRVDIHRLFDKGLMRIQQNSSKKLEIVIHDIAKDDYSDFHHQELILPKDPLAVPSAIALEEHDKIFVNLWREI
jgi:hypothetical protein